MKPARCPVCGHDGFRTLYRLETAAVPGHIVECLTCALWFKQIPDDMQLDSLYDDAYADLASSSTYMNGMHTRAFFAQILKKMGTTGRGKRLLDIGTGTGTLLEVAREQGYDAEGVELNPTLAKKAREKGFTVHLQNAVEEELPGQFDIITMLDLIEHIHTPHDILTSCYQALKPDGCLAVFTPNHRGAVVSLAHTLYCIGMTNPVDEIFGGIHVAFYTDHTLKLALEQSGFIIDMLWRFPYDLRRPGQPIPFVSLLAIGAVEWIGMPFGRVFRMVAYARKPKHAT